MPARFLSQQLPVPVVSQARSTANTGWISGDGFSPLFLRDVVVDLVVVGVRLDAERRALIGVESLRHAEVRDRDPVRVVAQHQVVIDLVRVDGEREDARALRNAAHRVRRIDAGVRLVVGAAPSCGRCGCPLFCFTSRKGSVKLRMPPVLPGRDVVVEAHAARVLDLEPAHVALREVVVDVHVARLADVDAGVVRARRDVEGDPAARRVRREDPVLDVVVGLVDLHREAVDAEQEDAPRRRSRSP